MARSRPIACFVALVVVLAGFGALVALPGQVRPVGGQGVGTPEPSASSSTISVTGQGTVRTEPDSASFVAGVEATASTLGEAQAEANDRMTAIIDALRAAGVTENDIRTVAYNVDVIREDGVPPQPVPADAMEGAEASAQIGQAAATPDVPGIRGFRVINLVRVEVDDPDRLGALLDTAVAQGANTISGVSFFLEDPSVPQARARAAAMQDARTTAEELAAAADLTVGRVQSITEEGGPPSPASTGRVEADAALASGAPIEPGQTEIVVVVRVTYELEPPTPGPIETPAATPEP
ncbi:MAG: SIMPL domain-containing protein [Chloroflexota bacterium]|nr:SIMPL domain-containing protein [Chloroflexota bacterium]